MGNKEKRCPLSGCDGVIRLDEKTGRWKCSKCGGIFVMPSITMEDTSLPSNKEGISDVSQKQLERISEMEKVQLVVLLEGDTAIVFRQSGVLETTIPKGQADGEEPISPCTFRVLLSLLLFQDEHLFNLAQKRLQETQLQMRDKNGD